MARLRIAPIDLAITDVARCYDDCVLQCQPKLDQLYSQAAKSSHY